MNAIYQIVSLHVGFLQTLLDLAQLSVAVLHKHLLCTPACQWAGYDSRPCSQWHPNCREELSFHECLDEDVLTFSALSSRI